MMCLVGRLGVGKTRKTNVKASTALIPNKQLQKELQSQRREQDP